MDTPITHAEQSQFEKAIDAELKRLADEDSRQNKRIDALEESQKQIGSLASSVEKLAVNMGNMHHEQERQGKRLELLESRNEISNLNVTMERVNTAMENALAVQKQQGERLETLEKRDGEKWRSVWGYVTTALIGGAIGFFFHYIGMI